MKVFSVAAFLGTTLLFEKSNNGNVQIVTSKQDDQDHVFEFVVWFDVEHSK